MKAHSSLHHAHAKVHHSFGSCAHHRLRIGRRRSSLRAPAPHATTAPARARARAQRLQADVHDGCGPRGADWAGKEGRGDQLYRPNAALAGRSGSAPPAARSAASAVKMVKRRGRLSRVGAPCGAGESGFPTNSGTAKTMVERFVRDEERFGSNLAIHRTQLHSGLRDQLKTATVTEWTLS